MTFTVTIPSSSGTTSTSRHPAYTSPNTGSVAIALESVNGTVQSSSTPSVVALSASTKGCSSGSAGVTCSVTVSAPAGDDLFSIATYQSNNATGTVLASTTVAANVGAAGATVALDLGGVPASVSFSPARLPLIDDGAVHSLPVVINAADASGATIVGSASYQSPVSLQIENDPAGALALSTTSVSRPGAVVTITYNAGKPLAQGEIVATDNAMKSATLIAAPLNISPTPVTMFDDATSASLALSESGFSGTYAVSVANTADASVVVNPGTLNSGAAVANITPKVHFDVTSLAVSDGNVTAIVPLQIVPHNSSYSSFGREHQMLSPVQMIADAQGNLWASDAGTGSLDEFNPSNDTYTAYVVDPTLEGPMGIALDASGNIWYADGSQIGEFTPSTQVNTSYSAGLEANANVVTIVPGASGTMWFYDQATFATYPSGKPTYFGSISTSTGAITEYESSNGAGPTSGAMSMVLAKDGSIWFADQYNSAIGHLNTSSGAITEYSTGAPAYPQQSPMQLTVAPSGTIWFLSTGFTSDTASVGSLNPSSDAITYYPNVPAGDFESFAVGSDGNLYFVEDPFNGLGLSSQLNIGVLNPVDGAVYEYPNTILPQFAKDVSLVNGGSGTLWILDAAYGEIGKVTFK
ncbi:MAG: hypothetical protein WBD74_15270 [Candidatus Aquilonibacter sp.]